ncbi:hypothetical protein ACJDU8_07220 [Clostridium sp. WILCCON 0269]|uniref:Uncharacterized protein n=1 Tax=Candidatus Clostridium eludens TaxID=3381663 RepID=A0ABW8SH91_9CLOT
MKSSKIFLIIIVILIFIMSFIGVRGSLIENLEILIGVGTDIDVDPSNTIYGIPFIVYIYFKVVR